MSNLQHVIYVLLIDINLNGDNDDDNYSHGYGNNDLSAAVSQVMDEVKIQSKLNAVGRGKFFRSSKANTIVNDPGASACLNLGMTDNNEHEALLFVETLVKLITEGICICFACCCSCCSSCCCSLSSCFAAVAAAVQL